MKSKMISKPMQRHFPLLSGWTCSRTTFGYNAIEDAEGLDKK